MGKMAIESKISPAETAGIPPALKVRSLAVPAACRRYFVWAQIIVAFMFLELAIWAPSLAIRNRWGAIAIITILVLVLIDRPSLERLGLALPKPFGASVVLGIGLATVVFMVILVSWTGGEIPANSTWPSFRLAWGYVIWAMVQEFMLQSFFFNRFEELHGSSAAVWMASTLFAAAHLPSPILTTATLIGALFFCEMFRRYRSIYPLAIIHAMLGLTIAILTPDSLLHHMRVGIGYLRYQ
ncbi:MAG: CPBP family intramembrane glutamic endopeptidase [Terriglobales bacterium]|jgi:membrane protease YdiL (CAAX protease family)